MRPLSLFALLLTLVAAGAARADIVVPHMGRLVLVEGSTEMPVTGVRKLKFSLHSRSVDAQGESNLVWEETYPSVEVQEGFYRVELGDTGGGRAPLVVDDVIGVETLWLEVTVYESDDATTGMKLSPRMRFAPSFGANFAYDATRLGGAPSTDYLKKEVFEQFKTELTGGASGGLTIPWNNIDGVPADFKDGVDDGLRQVTVGGTAIEGAGTGDSPLQLKESGVETRHLKDGSVTAAKLAPNAVTPDVFVDGSVSPDKLQSCPEGQILKMQSGRWQCGVDTGSGGSLTFNVLAPIEQVPGNGGAAATVQLKDGGIEAVKLADGAVTSAKLAEDAASLAKLTGGAASTAATGAFGVGVAAPNARLEVGAWPAAGVTGTGTITYAQNTTTVTVAGGDFRTQVRPGDLIQLGNLGWRTVMAVASATSLTIEQGYTATYNGNFSVRRATLRTAAIVETPAGNVGIGIQAPTANLHVGGTAHVTGAVEIGGDMIVNRNGNARIFTGTGVDEQNRYLELLNSPAKANASGLKIGGLLVADSYSHANPGKNDAVIKGHLRVDGGITSDLFLAQAMCGVMNPNFDYGTAYKAPSTQTCAAFCASREDGRCAGGLLSSGGHTARHACNYTPGAQYEPSTYCCCH